MGGSTLGILFTAASALVFCQGVTKEDGESKVLLCYYAEWSTYRKAPGAFYVSNVDPKLCTHYVHAYTGMNETTNKIMSRNPNGDYELNGNGQIAAAVALKQKNPKLKVMVSCGGWSEGSVKFSNMASSKEKRQTFISSIVEYLRSHKLDGFDMAWEYPNDRGGIPEDKENFATFLEELRSQFDNHGYILTAQLMGKRYIVDGGYDVPRIANALHYISLVTYQYHSPGERRTGHQAPLRSDDDLNVEYSLNYMIRKGAPPEKILLGFSTYGHQYIMDESVTDGNYVGVSASQTYEGPWSYEAGFIGYNEVCYTLTGGENWQEHWDNTAKVPYAVKGNKFMSYDDRRSYREKLNLLKLKKLAGAMVWSIDTDDFKGQCYQLRYPLISEIKNALGSSTTSERTDEIISSVISHEFKKK